MIKKHITNKPIVVNGITYSNQEELDERIKLDLEKLAQFLLSVYRKKGKLSKD